MTEELVRVRLDSGVETSVGRSFAESHDGEGLEVLLDDDGNELPATSNGFTLDPTYPPEAVSVTGDDGESVSVDKLKGAPLNEALEAAGLSLDGKLAEKQKRLADHLAGQSGGGLPPGHEDGGGSPPAVTE